MNGVFALVEQKGQISLIKIGKKGFQGRRKTSDDRPDIC